MIFCDPLQVWRASAWKSSQIRLMSQSTFASGEETMVSARDIEKIKPPQNSAGDFGSNEAGPSGGNCFRS